MFPVTGRLLLLALLLLAGCRQYPPVSSKESLSLMRLVYAACNTRDSARLDRAESELARLVAEGKVGEAERSAFERIMKQAREGEWKQAERAAFRFAEDQIGRGGAR